MHDSEIDCILANAFNSNDITGSDDFGYSVAWIDLQDFVESYGLESLPTDTEALSAHLIAYNDNERYALVYHDANGSRYAIPFSTRERMMRGFHEIEEDFEAWNDEIEIV